MIFLPSRLSANHLGRNLVADVRPLGRGLGALLCDGQLLLLNGQSLVPLLVGGHCERRSKCQEFGLGHLDDGLIDSLRAEDAIVTEVRLLQIQRLFAAFLEDKVGGGQAHVVHPVHS